MRDLFFEENNEKRVTFAMELTLCTLLYDIHKGYFYMFQFKRSG